MPAPAIVAASPAQAADAPGCAGEIARFRAVMANDLATGNVGRPVHDRIARDLDRAGTACSAGMTIEALAILRLAKAQNGYP